MNLQVAGVTVNCAHPYLTTTTTKRNITLIVCFFEQKEKKKQFHDMNGVVTNEYYHLQPIKIADSVFQCKDI
jgi:hypothetical protein